MVITILRAGFALFLLNTEDGSFESKHVCCLKFWSLFLNKCRMFEISQWWINQFCFPAIKCSIDRNTPRCLAVEAAVCARTWHYQCEALCGMHAFTGWYNQCIALKEEETILTSLSTIQDIVSQRADWGNRVIYCKQGASQVLWGFCLLLVW